MTIFYILVLVLIVVFVHFSIEQAYTTNPNNPDRVEFNPIVSGGGSPKVDVNVMQCDSIPQGVGATITCHIDSITVSSAGYNKTILHRELLEFALRPANITDNSFSVGKAAAGVVLLGGLGALAGMTGNNKKNLKVLSVVYSENGETKYMTFLQKLGEGRSVKADSYLLEKSYNNMVGMINK